MSTGERKYGVLLRVGTSSGFRSSKDREDGYAEIGHMVTNPAVRPETTSRKTL